jgi:biotin carboxyl carrier protein
MADLIASAPGEIVELFVDEGTMIAEEDELAMLLGPAGAQVIATVTPGVLREWFVRPGDIVDVGSRLALIDET